MTINTAIKLGSVQHSFLDAMRRHLTYRRGGGWYWVSTSRDSRLLRSLAKHGFVNIIFEDACSVVEAEVTEAGIAWLLANPRKRLNAA